MSCPSVRGRLFVRQVRPILERHDVDALVCFLERHWPGECLGELIAGDHEDAIKVALVGLSLTGTMSDNLAVARLLYHDDPDTVALAERALWSIWFRAGNERASAALAQAVRLIDDGRFDQAILLLNTLVDREPDLAEGYHQRGIAWFLNGDYARAAGDFETTLRLNPCHFAALAGLGHCHAASGCPAQALEAYHRTLALHPRIEGIRQSIHHVRQCLLRSRPASLPQPSTIRSVPTDT